MDIGVITEGIDESDLVAQPWIYHRDALLDRGIRIHLHRRGDLEGFRRGFDAMLLHVWQDWANPKHFDPRRILPILEHYAAYRSRFPQTVQIVLNHTDMSRRPYATPYWREGDPVLYKAPAYDRTELAPFPPETIWAYEMLWGESCFLSAGPPTHRAGFIGSESGPPGYRQRVAAATARVGIGMCAPERPVSKPQYNAMMASCQIVVCPRGWGENSSRHWDAWKSGKPVLTDRECDCVEMIPGVRLREGEHYLVFDDPDQIPDIVSDWTRPSRAAELAAIARNGRRAALSYDPLDRITQFFRSIIPGRRADRMEPDRLAAPVPTEASKASVVDVVIPVRNGARFIEACLDSVRAQTLQPNSVIVVDDGSTDETAALLQAYAARWPKLHLIRSIPRGVSHARNLALQASQAQFVAFLDSDDVWMVDKLERQMALLTSDRPQLGIVHCACVQIDELGETFRGGRVLSPTRRGDIFQAMIKAFYPIVAPSTVIARRDLIMKAGGFDETLTCGEDLDLWLKLARVSHVDYVAASLVGLRVHPGNSCSRAVAINPELVLFQRLKIWNRWIDQVSDRAGILAEFRREAASVGVANVMRLHPEFGLYRRLKRSDIDLARMLVDRPLDYLQISHRISRMTLRLKILIAKRLIMRSRLLLRLCQLAGKFEGVT
jgi:glycosyltransferase involved in cell wall biosynthesis